MTYHQSTAACRRNGSLSIAAKQPSGKEVPRFLNRMLGMRLADQTMLFQYFHDTYEAKVPSCRP